MNTGAWTERIGEITAEHPLMRESDVAEGIRQRLIGLFIQTLPEMLADFEKHAGNSALLAKTAHAIKGAAGFVNARRVWALAGEFETHVKLLSPDDTRLFIAAITSAFEDTKRALG